MISDTAPVKCRYLIYHSLSHRFPSNIFLLLQSRSRACNTTQMSMDYPTRPQTPQAMLHRLPDRPDTPLDQSTKPSKYIILILASTAVAGTVQIAKSVSNALSCPLFQGDSLHKTAAKAASVGAAIPWNPSEVPDAGKSAAGTESGANEARYQRMWLSKMTRTGLLFPEESRPANTDFPGFGGASSTSGSRRGSGSSVASLSSDAHLSTISMTNQYINKPSIIAPSQKESFRKANLALMVLTHPVLEQWHKDAIRSAVGEYGIGVIFVPLEEDEEEEELPILKPLDSKTMTGFGSLGGGFGAASTMAGNTLSQEILLRLNVDATVADLADEIVNGVTLIMHA